MSCWLGSATPRQSPGYSTEEQLQTSTEDQIANCRRFLADNLPRDIEPERLAIEVIGEREISGERMSRPGINEVWAGIEAGRWDLIIAEESSRLYRHMTFAGQLFNTAVDAGIRILCPTDSIDTADEDWPERLNSSQSSHSRANLQPDPNQAGPSGSLGSRCSDRAAQGGVSPATEQAGDRIGTSGGALILRRPPHGATGEGFPVEPRA